MMLQWAHSRDWLDAKQTYIFSGTQLNYGHTSFYCAFKYCIFSNRRLVSMLCQASLLVPFFQDHWLTSCLYVTFWQFSQYFKLFHYYYICYSDFWSMTFDITLVIILRSFELHPHKTVNLINTCMCSDGSTDTLLICLPLFGPPYSLRHNNMEIRSIKNLSTASMCCSKNNNHMYLILNQKL